MTVHPTRHKGAAGGLRQLFYVAAAMMRAFRLPVD